MNYAAAMRSNLKLPLSGCTSLAELIDAERQCCPFLTFVLQVPAHKNALVLEIKRPEGAKRLIRAELLDD
jgi:hypothetical protein